MLAGSVDSEGSSRPALLAPESVDQVRVTVAIPATLLRCVIASLRRCKHARLGNMQLNLRTADPYRGVIAKDKCVMLSCSCGWLRGHE